MEVIGVYNGWLVFLSIIVPILSSYTALQIVKRMMHAKDSSCYKWLILGSVIFGGGIWSMHFIAMLAYDMGILVMYEIPAVLLSMVAVLVSSFVAFFLISKGVHKAVWRFAGAVLIAVSIISMHYIGMDAMEMDAYIKYDSRLVGVSIGIALVVSFASLRLFSLHSQKQVIDNRKEEVKVRLSAVFMGVAVSGMHYTGMASASFYLKGDGLSAEGPAIDPGSLGWVIAVGVILIVVFIMALIKLDAEMETTNTRLEVANQMYRAIVETANDAVVTSDDKGMVMSWNKAAENIFGFKEEEMVGISLLNVMPEKYRKAHELGIKRYNQTRISRAIGRTLELEGLHKNGSTFPIELSLSTVEDGGRTYFTGIIRDITERVESEQRIRDLVYQDDLTQLPNRRALYDQLAESIERVDAPIAVMFLDLDRFKQVNDVYGHRIGDLLLYEGAERTKSCLTEKDLLARQSGDEFIMVLPERGALEVKQIAQSILEKIAAPFVIDGREIYISGSIGICLYPEDGSTPDLLIKRADTSMYQAKQRGGNQCCFYTKEIDESLSRKLQLENGLRKALERDEIEVYYQPQVDTFSERITGFEALARWNHPELGFIRPDEFIPMAEDTKLIVPLGEKVLLEACHQFSRWLAAGYNLDRIGVNLSAIQFRDPSITATVSHVLKETNIRPEHLELELTETIVQDSKEAIPVMQHLKGMGVQLALDDFGTGYSSLSYLKDFPLDTIKVDKSFIDAIHQSEKDRAVVDTLIRLAAKLEMNVIAEGVETESQLNYLRIHGCTEYQGYVFSAPLKKGEAGKLLEKGIDW
ncbi:PAS domain S-box-containing protein/diguanylate cyclase (GGDEF) domain-containing protein [Halobacillus karajensis]|uniref:EAL domain-containing protein n=1 Tax=Halobacillus karajensis TaxID=195088 RepID=UPI0008A7CEBE|nr:EAL domain-containing protein [Halobacillus karajensis]SEH89654.1 PAS domain S-box-containing protein/diguanylate cyclase (GGDEF) domain-containing protein [Halobacillus karajensis]